MATFKKAVEVDDQHGMGSAAFVDRTCMGL
jgi:hypothetical protein